MKDCATTQNVRHLDLMYRLSQFFQKARVIDDQPVSDWRRLVYVHPANAEAGSVEAYWKEL